MRKPTWSTTTTVMRLRRTISSQTSDYLPPIRTRLQLVDRGSHCWPTPPIPTPQPVEPIPLMLLIQCSMLIHLDSLRACTSLHRSASIKRRVEDSQPGVKYYRLLALVPHVLSFKRDTLVCIF